MKTAEVYARAAMRVCGRSLMRNADMQRSWTDWLVAGLAIAAMLVASQVLLALESPWYSFGIFLVALWALLMLYYRGPFRHRRSR